MIFVSVLLFDLVCFMYGSVMLSKKEEKVDKVREYSKDISSLHWMWFRKIVCAIEQGNRKVINELLDLFKTEMELVGVVVNGDELAELTHICNVSGKEMNGSELVYLYDVLYGYLKQVEVSLGEGEEVILYKDK